MTEEERAEALEVTDSMLRRCRGIQPKFAPGTAQHTLLKNRLAALEIARTLLAGETAAGYPDGALAAAREPVASILRKCEKARAKYGPDRGMYRRFDRIIRTMRRAEMLIDQELNTRGRAM